jgi:hypothetical protein
MMACDANDLEVGPEEAGGHPNFAGVRGKRAVVELHGTCPFEKDKLER